MSSMAEQDYIKSIYKLQQSGGDVTTTALAQKLGITAASVSGMLRKLSRAKLITHRHYRGVRLTKRGENSAVAVMRRHRLIELFLVEVLGMPWDKVHHEAEVLEHAVSDEVLERIDELLGYPERDPHGSPIPTPAGKVATQATKPLSEMIAGARGAIAEIPDDDPALLQHLSGLGLIPGSRIRIIRVLEIDGTRVVKRGRQEVSISPKVAAEIQVFSEE